MAIITVKHNNHTYGLMHVPVTDIFREQQRSHLIASRLGWARNQVALKRRLAGGMDQLAGFASSNRCANRNSACYFFCFRAPSGAAFSCSSCPSQEGMLLEGINCLGK